MPRYALGKQESKIRHIFWSGISGRNFRLVFPGQNSRPKFWLGARNSGLARNFGSQMNRPCELEPTVGRTPKNVLNFYALKKGQIWQMAGSQRTFIQEDFISIDSCSQSQVAGVACNHRVIVVSVASLVKQI